MTSASLRPARASTRSIWASVTFCRRAWGRFASRSGPPPLRCVAREFVVLLPPFLSQRRDRNADDLAVARGVQALFAHAQRLLDGADLALVVDLHDQQSRLWRADLGQLVERGRGAVVRNHDLVDEGGVRAAGPDAGELRGEVVDRLRHLRLCVAQYRINHPSAPTKVPISSPSTTRSMLPGSRRLKTTMGTLLSMQRVRAVLSITSMPRFSTSR